MSQRGKAYSKVQLTKNKIKSMVNGLRCWTEHQGENIRMAVGGDEELPLVDVG